MTYSAERARPALSKTWLQNPAVPYCLYLLLVGAFWIPYACHLNADGVSYLSIASEYAGGHWTAAVNTYWSPLFSWLLAAGMALKAPPIAFARVLLIVFGFLGMLGLERLLAIFELEPAIAAGARITAAPMFCYFALHDVTADVLTLALLLFYLSLTCRQRMTLIHWTCAGALGSLLYLAKAYCLVFVAAHLLVTGSIRIRATRNKAMRRAVAGSCAGAMTVLLLLAAPWLVLISQKAGRFTLSTAGSYNLALAVVGPGNHPMLTRGLFAPPNPYAVSIWEDPDEMHLHAPAEPSALRFLLQRLKIVGHNLGEFTRYQLSASPLAPLILVAFAYWTVTRWRAGKGDLAAACLLATYFVYPGAYFLTFVEHRYIWIEDTLLLVMAAYILDRLRRERLLVPRALVWAGVMTAISFCCAPLFIVTKHRNDLHAVSSSLPALRALRLSGNVASNARWDDTQYLAYQLGLRYYGMPAQGSAQANESTLVRYGVHYVFVWHSRGAALPPRPGEKLLGSKLLDVYALPKN